MSTRLQKFAHKYGKKVGGNLCLEGSIAAKDLVKHKDLPDIDVPEKVVTLTGYIEYNPAKARKTGKDGATVRTGYVVGLAVNDGELYAITTDSVYRLHGPWVAEVITEDPFLNTLWDDVKKGILTKASKKG